MTNRELLELAAKAAGIEIIHHLQKERDEIGFGDSGLWTHGAGSCWNPLENDGDAFRLMVDLRLWRDELGICCVERVEDHDGDAYSATRRAITRAAAEIGRVKA